MPARTKPTRPTVLVTRTRERASALIASLNDAGFHPLSFPCMAIRHVPFDRTAGRPTQSDTVIFTSQHAVDGMHSIIPFPWTSYNGRILAIGPATAQRLASLGQAVDQEPVRPYNSEALLTLGSLATGDGARVAIVKGQGGRTHLHDTLLARNFSVTTFDTYERVMPVVDETTRHKVFEEARIDVITVTSNEMLQNLIALASEQYTPKLLTLPLITVSERAVGLAQELGFSNAVRVAESPGDDALVTALVQWRDDC